MMRMKLHALAFAIAAALIVSILPISTATAGDDAGQTTLTIKGMSCGGCVGAVKARVITAVLLGAAFYITYRRPTRACAPGEACEMPGASRIGRALLWLATVLILLASTFPYYSVYLF